MSLLLHLRPGGKYWHRGKGRTLLGGVLMNQNNQAKKGQLQFNEKWQVLRNFFLWAFLPTCWTSLVFRIRTCWLVWKICFFPHTFHDMVFGLFQTRRCSGRWLAMQCIAEPLALPWLAFCRCDCARSTEMTANSWLPIPGCHAWLPACWLPIPGCHFLVASLLATSYMF